MKPKLLLIQKRKGERKGKNIVLSLIKLRVLAHVQGTILLTTMARIWHGDMSLANILCPPAALGITQENLICITQHYTWKDLAHPSMVQTPAAFEV